MNILGIIASSKLIAAAGDFQSIATVSVGGGGAANVEFTSIPGTFTHLQIRGIHRSTATTPGAFYAIKYQYNGDTGSNYTYHYIVGTGSAANAFAGTSQSDGWAGVCTSDGITASVYSAGVIDILDYANTNKYKTMRILDGTDANGTGEAFFMSSLWMSTSAITSIKLYPNTDNWAQYSSFALYGIKEA